MRAIIFRRLFRTPEVFSLFAACFAMSAALGEDAANGPSSNLLTYPGFETSRNVLLGFVKSCDGGYSIDENEKHTGRRSIKFETGKRDIAQGVTWIIGGAEVKAPGKIVISGWSKAYDMSGVCDNDYAICADINFIDGTVIRCEAAKFKTGTHDWEFSSRIVEIPKPVKNIHMYALLRGKHKGTAWFDDLFIGNFSEGMKPYNGSMFAYSAPAKTSALTVRLGKIETRMKLLSEKIDQADRSGKDATMQRISLAIARLFEKYILLDSALDITACQQLKFSDLAILGQEEVQKRIDGLGEFEMGECERIVENAISELESPVRLPNSGYYRKDVFFREGVKVGVKDGCFTLDGRPTFFHGFYGAYPQAVGPVLRSLGVNLAGPVEPHAAWLFEKDNGIQPYFQAAKDNGLFTSPLICPRGVKWLTDAPSDIFVEKYWFRPAFAFDIDHPDVKRYVSTATKFAVSQVKYFPNLLCYHVMGEEQCRADYRGPATNRRYAEWLQTRFSNDLAQLNQAWGKSFKDFNDAACASDSQSRGMQYCWHLFNQHRLTSFNQWIIDAIRDVDEGGGGRFQTCYPCAGCLVGQPVGGWQPTAGVNIEDVTNQSTVPGWDGGFFPAEAAESDRYWSGERKKYNLAWRDEMSYYDFAKSIQPGRPIFDPEWHAATSVRHQSPLGISADYIRLALWMEHLHGMNAQIAWGWGRGANGSPLRFEFLGGFLTQPQLLEGWARAMAELQRLAEYVALFPAQERKVRILYSEASAVQDGNAYSGVLRNVYEALYFQDYPVGFVTEKMIAAGALKDCSLLVAPNAQYISDTTLEGVKQFIRNGGAVAVVGQGCFKFDEYGRERNIALMDDDVVRISGTATSGWTRQFDSLISSVGVERPARVLSPDGNSVEGLEMRAMDKGDRRILYLLNLKHCSVELELRRKDGNLSKVHDLINNRMLDVSKTVCIQPRGMLLLEVGKHE